MFFFGGGKCPNLGVVNVRILGVVNVLLANDSQSAECITVSGFFFSFHILGSGYLLLTRSSKNECSTDVQSFILNQQII